MSIAKFQRIMRGVILPVAALGWMTFDVLTRYPIDATTVFAWLAMFGWPVLTAALGTPEDKK